MLRSGRLRNRILAAMSAEEFDLLAPAIESVSLSSGAILLEPGQVIDAVYFPLGGMLSTLVMLEDGTPVEGFAVGNEGFAPAAPLVGETLHPHRLIQQVEGECLRIPAEIFAAAMPRCPRLGRIVQHYLLMRVDQVSRYAACNLRHPVERRMVRWLLTAADLIGHDEFGITQEFLSAMLGVRRQSVSMTTGSLETAGLIEHRRGRFRILDRARTEAAACECYRMTKDRQDRFLQFLLTDAASLL